ncbi:MAG: site-2 protease family protein [Candidatus Aegiribacteria sp.]|nr:site-2 protease family protein [Candidatus Aegiribacteria sp.]
MGIETPFIIVLVFFSVVCHEIAHGYVALKLGDPTAYRAGRLTFNPVSHIDPIGTIMLPALFLITNSPIMLAWAKPVPVNPGFFRNPKTGMMWVAIAGPATNFAIALVLTLLLHLLGSAMPAILMHSLAMAALMNIVLMVFNLLPIPPLDGSRIVARFLNGQALYNYRKLERFGLFIVFGLLWLGVISSILYPALNFAVRHLDLYQYLPRF